MPRLQKKLQFSGTIPQTNVQVDPLHPRQQNTNMSCFHTDMLRRPKRGIHINLT